MKSQNFDVTLDTIISRHKKAEAEKWLFTVFSSMIAHGLRVGLSKKHIKSAFVQACDLAESFEAKFTNHEKK